MVVVQAPAKVNLALEVLRRREDGWHELDSIVAHLDWHDLLGIDFDHVGIDLRIASTASSASSALAIPAGPENLVHRAAVAATTVLGLPGAAVWLDKRLPVAAGLGGGSADAAAVLRAAWEATGRAVPLHLLFDLAADIGADVPALLVGGALRMRGRGERLQPISAPRLHLVVAFAGWSSTAATYAALRPHDIGGSGRCERVAAALQRGEVPADDDLGSALEAAARRAHRHLGPALEHLRSLTPGRGWHLTGSGGAAFRLCASRSEAEELAALVQSSGMVARPCRTIGPLLHSSPRSSPPAGAAAPGPPLQSPP